VSELVEVFRAASERALRERALVLASVGIPSLALAQDGVERLLVEAHWAERAHEELARYEEENVGFRRKRVLPPAAPLARAAAAAFAVLLVAFFLAQTSEFGGLDWSGAGGASAAAIRAGELWRASTALVLHVDVPHLFSNLIFGLLFSYLLFHAHGGGLGLFALVACGTLGNLTNAWVHGPGHASIGASTAVFAAVGLLGSSEARARHLLAEPTTRRAAPISAALVFLLYLGVGDAQAAHDIDVLAHVFGLAWGLVLGTYLPSLPRARVDSRGLQLTLAALALAWLAGAWVLALR
jgi:membrane associated rhomboid family serine protease